MHSTSPHPGAAQHHAEVVRHRRRSRRRMVAIISLAQVPAVLLLAWLTGGWGVLAAVPAGVLTASFLVAFPGPYQITPKSPLHLYLGLWPFFAWWVAAVIFALAAAVLVPAAALAGLSVPGAGAVAAAVGVATGVRAIWRRPRVRRVSLAFPDLPREFDGYKIAQISDVHCGAFAPEKRVDAWVRRMCGLGADLIAVTGDLVVSGTSHVDTVGRSLGGLTQGAKDGVLACMGNHDYFGAGEPLVRSLENHGIQVLRNRAHVLERGDARLVVAGVDDTWSGRAELPRTLARRPAGAFTLLLAHDPDVFPEAAALGARLTLSGHTHGGQIAVPFLARRLNLARLMSRFTAGTYWRNGCALYVNRGVGTSGPPIRVGVPGELTLLTLRRADREA